MSVEIIYVTDLCFSKTAKAQFFCSLTENSEGFPNLTLRAIKMQIQSLDFGVFKKWFGF